MTSSAPADALRPVGAPIRLARSAAAALACVLAAATGHLAAGGRMQPVAVAIAFLGSAAIAWLLSARRVTPGQLFGLLVLCQVAVHLTAPTHDMSMGAGMLAAHAVATVVSAAVLARGESFLWQVAERLGLRLSPLSLSPVLVPVARHLPAVVVPRALHDVRLAHSRWSRGPPSGLV